MHTCSTRSVDVHVVLGLSYSFMSNVAWSKDVHVLLGLSFQHFISTFFPLFSTFFRSPLVSELISCGCKSSYSFPPTTFKLCIFVLHGLKMCVRFWGYPPIIRIQKSQPFTGKAMTL